MVASKGARDRSFSAGEYGYCHFCGCWGVIVSAFARRGYGKAKMEVFNEKTVFVRGAV